MHDNSTLNKIINQAIFLIFMYNNRAMQNLLQSKQPNQTKTKTNASALVEMLSELGVDSIFGYPGASVLSIYNELSEKNNIKHYLVRHEQAAVHAAEGYARISGRAGVVLVTSGPGFTNTITGIANAYADSTPLVILAGDVAESQAKGKVFQDIDIISLTKTVCKKNYKLSKDDNIKDVIKNAFQEANSGVKGPVVLALPRNILESEFTEKKSAQSYSDLLKQDFLSQIEYLINSVNNSQKPLILLGGGAINASSEVIEFAKRIKCPVVSTLMGIGIYPSSNKEFLGMIGINGTYAANSALNKCDLIIALGSAFSDRSTCKNPEFAKNAKIISINLKKINQNLDYEVQADLKEFLNAFLEETTNRSFNGYSEWNKELEVFREEGIGEVSSSSALHSSYVLKTLSDYTREMGPVIVTDVGQHQMLTAQFFDFNKPRKFITSGGLGTMGFGLPAAIGAHIANPDNLVLNITGDGSFQMNLQELATCREHNIPLKIVIMNNSYLGMVRELQEKIYNKRYQVEMINPDFTKIAEAYDLFAISVKRKDELIPALKKAIEYNGTAIIDVVIDSFENI